MALGPGPVAGDLILTPTTPASGVVLPSDLRFGDGPLTVEVWVRLRGRQQTGAVIFYAGDGPISPPPAVTATLSGGGGTPNAGGLDALLIEVVDLNDEDADVMIDNVAFTASVLRVTTMRNGTGGFAWITGDFPRDAWARLAFVFTPSPSDPASCTLQLHSNGTVYNAPTPMPMLRDVARPYAYLGFGGPPPAAPAAPRPPLVGALGGFRLWAGRALSREKVLCALGSTEFSAPYASAVPANATSLVISLPFETCGSTVVDAAGSNRTATLSGAGAACSAPVAPLLDFGCRSRSRQCTLQAACGLPKGCVSCPAPGAPFPVNGSIYGRPPGMDPKCPIPGGVRIFREGSGYIHIDPFPFGANMSVELWAYFHVVPDSWQRVFDMADGTETNGVSLLFSKGRQIMVPNVYYTSYDYKPPRPNENSFRAGSWIHLAVSWRGLGRYQTNLDPPYPQWAEVSFYWNGTLVSRGWGYLPEVANRTRIWIGRSQEEQDPSPDMTVSELRFWNYSRTQDEIVCSMRRALLGTEDGLIAYFTFSEGTGDRTYSASPGGVGASLRGAYEWSSAPGLLELSSAPLTNVRATASAGRVRASEAVTFTAFVDDASAVRLKWDFQDGNTQLLSLPQVSHAFLVEGTFNVTLSASNEASAAAPVAVPVTVVPPVVESISPSVGPSRGGTEVTVRGREFAPSPRLACAFAPAALDTALPLFAPADIGNGTFETAYGPAQVVPATLLDPTTIVCVAPASRPRAAQVRVSNGGVAFHAAADPDVSAFEIQGCPPGYEASSFAETCRPCSPGWYSAGGSAALGVVGNCFPCANSTYQDQPAAPACVPCPENSAAPQGAFSPDLCLCAPGFLSSAPRAALANGTSGGAAAVVRRSVRAVGLVSRGPPDQVALRAVVVPTAAFCAPCPQGLLCERGAARPLAAPGYWIVNADPTALVARPCVPMDACLGGANQCARGYGGQACAECSKASDESPAFFRLAGRCYQCPDGQRYVLFIVVPVLFVALFAILYRSSARRPSETLTTLTEAFAFIQVMAVFNLAGAPWPPPVRNLLAGLSFSNLNLQLLHPECNIGGNAFLVRWSVMALSPFLFAASCGLFAAGFAVRDYFYGQVFLRSGEAADPLARRAEWRSRLRRLTRTMAQFLILAYVQLCTTALEPFACVESPSGLRYLASEPSVVCSSDDPVWPHLRVAAGLAIALYVVGLPLSLAALVIRTVMLPARRRVGSGEAGGSGRLTREGTVGDNVLAEDAWRPHKQRAATPAGNPGAPLGAHVGEYLTARYRPGCAWWEVLVLARKLLLVLINVYGAASAPAPAQGTPDQVRFAGDAILNRAYFSMLVIVGSLLLTVAFAPFPTRRLNSAISIGFLANAIILFASTVFVSGGLEGYVQELVTWLTLFAFAVAVLVLLAVCLAAYVDSRLAALAADASGSFEKIPRAGFTRRSMAVVALWFATAPDAAAPRPLVDSDSGPGRGGEAGPGPVDDPRDRFAEVTDALAAHADALVAEGRRVVPSLLLPDPRHAAAAGALVRNAPPAERRAMEGLFGRGVPKFAQQLRRRRVQRPASAESSGGTPAPPSSEGVGTPAEGVGLDRETPGDPNGIPLGPLGPAPPAPATPGQSSGRGPMLIVHAETRGVAASTPSPVPPSPDTPTPRGGRLPPLPRPPAPQPSERERTAAPEAARPPHLAPAEREAAAANAALVDRVLRGAQAAATGHVQPPAAGPVPPSASPPPPPFGAPLPPPAGPLPASPLHGQAAAPRPPASPMRPSPNTGSGARSRAVHLPPIAGGPPRAPAAVPAPAGRPSEEPPAASDPPSA